MHTIYTIVRDKFIYYGIQMRFVSNKSPLVTLNLSKNYKFRSTDLTLISFETPMEVSRKCRRFFIIILYSFVILLTGRR